MCYLLKPAETEKHLRYANQSTDKRTGANAMVPQETPSKPLPADTSQRRASSRDYIVLMQSVGMGWFPGLGWIQLLFLSRGVTSDALTICPSHFN
jgi:hypothetical protein